MRISILCLLFLYTGGFAQDNTSQWNTRWSKTTAAVGETVELIITCNIADSWYMYGSDFDANLGPTVTTIESTPHASYKAAGALMSVKRKEKFDSLWGGKITYFTGKAEFRIKIKVLENNPNLHAILRYQVCSDAEGKCIPGSFEFKAPSLKVTGTTKTELPAPVKKDPGQGTNPASPSTSNSTTKQSELAKLEAEKQKTLTKDASGHDASVEYLRRFVKKYAGK